MAKEERIRKPSTPGQTIALAKKVLTQLFGLDADGIKDVVSRLERSGRSTAMAKHMQALSSGPVNVIIGKLSELKKEDPAEGDKESKEEPRTKAEKRDDRFFLNKKKEKKEPVKEGKGSFMEHLLSEVNVRTIAADQTTELGDKEARVDDARKSDAQLRLVKANRLKAQQDSKDPIDRQILQLQQKIALLRKKKSDQVDKG